MENITTNKIIDKLYKDQLEKKFHKKDMQALIASFLCAVREELHKGNKVSIAGLGSFSVRKRGETQKVIPGGKPVIVPAHTVVGFAASKFLADAVRDTEVEG